MKTYHVTISSLNFSSGLDSRYMISQLKPTDFNVLSLTTIASPHHGSAFADYMFERIGRMLVCIILKRNLLIYTPARQIKRIYSVIEYFGFETGAFSQLTREYMRDSFNPRTPDVEGVE
jgi:triacylglycerol lipase